MVHNAIFPETRNVTDITEALCGKYSDKIKKIRFVAETDGEWFFEYIHKKTNEQYVLKVYITDHPFDIDKEVLAVAHRKVNGEGWEEMI